MKPGSLHESAFAVAINALPFSLASARVISHDTVIANAGASRRSGVTWSHFPVRAARERCRDVLGIESLPVDVEQVMAMFPDGVLVVATVEVSS